MGRERSLSPRGIIRFDAGFKFQGFIEDSSGNHRGALYAEILLNDRYYVVGCTHPSANYAPSDYPPSGKHGSWEGENRFMH